MCERQWKPLSEEERYQRRQEIAVPILAKFHQWLQGQSVNVLPKSKIGEAVSYALNQWDAWVRYCEAGYLSIDNNLSEQMVKPCAMGRKAWLFLGSENGGATAAILYSLTASAKANRVHPYFYLRDVFDRLPEVIHDPLILPHLQAACEAARPAPTTRDRPPPGRAHEDLAVPCAVPNACSTPLAALLLTRPAGFVTSLPSLADTRNATPGPRTNSVNIAASLSPCAPVDDPSRYPRADRPSHERRGTEPRADARLSYVTPLP